MRDQRPINHRKVAIHPSTLAFLHEGRRSEGYSLLDFLHGYVYARWPYLYIGIGTGEHQLARVFGPLVRAIVRLFTNDSADGSPPGELPSHSADQSTYTTADGYHGKVVPLEAATQLVTVREPVQLLNLEQVIPYVRARDIILKNPDHIVALDCPCRSSRTNPCLPLEVCLIVGEPFASFVADHHPRRSRWITSQEAVEILKAEDERGHVHHAFFKDAMLGRFYAICNCCSCCCGAMQAQQRGTPMLASSGYLSNVDALLCSGCGTCEETCPFGAVSVNGQATVNPTTCMGCGICASHCEQGAITLQRDPSKGEPLEIFNLMAQLSFPPASD